MLDVSEYLGDPVLPDLANDILVMEKRLNDFIVTHPWTGRKPLEYKLHDDGDVCIRVVLPHYSSNGGGSREQALMWAVDLLRYLGPCEYYHNIALGNDYEVIIYLYIHACDAA